MTRPGAFAWERRADEPPARYARFMEYVRLPRSERGRWLASHGRAREWFRAYSWAARVAAYDDHAEMEYAQQLAEQRQEARAFHARAGRALMSFAISKINAIDANAWRPDQAVKLLGEARKIESSALFAGWSRELESSRAVLEAVGAGAGALDEWDVLAADLAATFQDPPPPPRS